MTGDRTIRIVNGVVHRPAKPWTPTIQSLLSHLHSRGLPVPEPLGYDEIHEYVRLVEGDAGPESSPSQLGLDGVRSAGTLLRQIHDATVDWRPPADAAWSVPHNGGAMICHGDPKPANMAWHDGQAVGLFDWDAARPGDRLSDVAYALIWFTPFDTDPTKERLASDRRARIDALLDGYGWREPFDIGEQVARRHAQAIDEVEWLGERGHQPHASWVADGWPSRWRRHLDAIRPVWSGSGASSVELTTWIRGRDVANSTLDDLHDEEE